MLLLYFYTLTSFLTACFLYTLRPDEGEFGVQEVVVIEDERNAPVSNPSASELPFPLPSASSHQNVSSSPPSQQPGTSGNAANHYEKQEENYEGHVSYG